MRSTRILMFLFFSLGIVHQLPLNRVAFQNAQTLIDAIVWETDPFLSELPQSSPRRFLVQFRIDVCFRPANLFRTGDVSGCISFGVAAVVPPVGLFNDSTNETLRLGHGLRISFP